MPTAEREKEIADFSGANFLSQAPPLLLMERERKKCYLDASTQIAWKKTPPAAVVSNQAPVRKAGFFSLFGPSGKKDLAEKKDTFT